MSEVKMLGEIVTYCSKCKLDLNHRIILMNGDKPERVLCLTCNGERKYRKKRRKTGTTAKKATQPATASEKSRARLSREETLWKTKLEDENVTPVTYRIDEAFKIDDRVYHPKFGIGLLIGFDHPDKVHVYFDGGLKILKGKKDASQE